MELSGPEPGTKVTQACEPIVYGVTIPRNAPNPKAAMAFMRFLLTVDEGMAIIRENGQDSAVPSPTRTYDKIPDALKPFARKG
jgi:molybdate/tungstate transport system substrate-binding protein